MPLDIEHLLPESRGGLTIRENLWLACSRCNGFKGERTAASDPQTDQVVPLFNPRSDHWLDHFAWFVDGITIVGRTPIGRGTVVLNNDHILIARQFWVMAGRRPPAQDRS